jgi:hypothetical protein
MVITSDGSMWQAGVEGKRIPPAGYYRDNYIFVEDNLFY